MRLGKSRGARSVDLEAFRQLVREHQPEVFDLARRLTGNHADASEVAQEVFIQLYAAIARISNLAHLRHWLLRAVAQRAVDRPWQPPDEPDCAPVTTDPGEEFTARVMARVELRWSHRREDFAPRKTAIKQGWRRIVLPLCAAAVCGAAVILALRMPGAGQKPAGGAVAGPETSATRHMPAGEAPPDAEAATTAVASMRTATPPDSSRHYTLLVLPPRHDSLDANAMAPVEAFHAALLAELRKAPDVVLLVPGVTAPPDALQSVDYLLAVGSIEERALASGGTAFRIANQRGGGSLSAAAPVSGPRWPVEIRIQPARQVRSAGFSSVLQISEDNASLLQLAAKQIETLRLRIFPDALVKQQLVARIRDTSLSAAERNGALADLLGTRDRGLALDAVDLGVIVAGAAAMPAQDRARLLRNLRGNSRAELVDTLLDSLRFDADTSVRFEALATLAADHGTDARVRAAMESVSRDDAAPVMRMAARRVRSGDAEWRRYLVATLKDTTLPPAERVAPLLLARESATTPAETSDMRSIMNDEEITAALMGIVRDSWFDHSQTSTLGDALDLVASSGDAAAPDLLVEIPPDAFRAGTVVAAQPAPQISPAAMAWLQKNRNNPRARRILEDIARGRVSPQAGFMIEQMMQQRPAPRRQD